MTVFDKHTRSAIANVPGGQLSVKSGSIKIDEGWAPYAQGTIVCPAPSAELLNALDPRNKVRIRIRLAQSFTNSDHVSVLSTEWSGDTLADLTTLYAGKKLSDITAAHSRPLNSIRFPATSRTFDLGLRSRPRTYQDGTISFSVASDEALLQDYALVDTKPYLTVGVNLRPVVQYVLEQIGAVLVDGDADATFEPDSANWDPGVSAWDYLAPLVQAASLRLWCDESRRWHLTDRALLAPGQITLAKAGTVVDGSDDISRDGDWYDAVVIVYTWTDVDGAQHTTYDVAAVDGYSKVLRVDIDRPYPGPGAAAGALRRSNDKAHATSVTAKSQYDAQPTMATSITLPDTDLLRGIISDVEWDLETLEMQVGTRGLLAIPPTAWSFGPVGVAWNDIPAGISWTEFDWTESI